MEKKYCNLKAKISVIFVPFFFLLLVINVIHIYLRNWVKLFLLSHFFLNQFQGRLIRSPRSLRRRRKGSGALKKEIGV